MSGRTRGPEHIRDLIGAHLRERGRQGRIGTGEIRALWPEVVGPEIAAHTRITALRKGTLSVAVDSAAHYYELSTFFVEEVRKKLNEHLSRDFVSKINFHLDLV